MVTLNKFANITPRVEPRIKNLIIRHTGMVTSTKLENFNATNRNVVCAYIIIKYKPKPKDNKLLDNRTTSNLVHATTFPS